MTRGISRWAVAAIVVSTTSVGVVIGSQLGASGAPSAPPPAVLGGPIAGIKVSPTFPKAGTDAFMSIAKIDVQLACQGTPIPVMLSGPIVVHRSNPVKNAAGHIMFTNVMQSLALTGTSPQLGTVSASLRPGTASEGQTTGLGGGTTVEFPATSFFDVFTDISLSGNPGAGPTTVFNTVPMHLVNSELLSIPPIDGEYLLANGPVKLYAAAGGPPLACVTSAVDAPTNPAQALMESQLQEIAHELGTP